MGRVCTGIYESRIYLSHLISILKKFNFFSFRTEGRISNGNVSAYWGKKKKDCFSFIFWCLEELTFQSKNARNEKEGFFLRKILKAIKIFPSKLVISLQIVLGEIDFFLMKQAFH